MSYIGEISSLLAACVWAIATLIYGQFSHQLSSLQLNLIKGLLSIGLMLIAVLMLQDAPVEFQTNHIYILMFSGVLGIAVGDTAYFASLRRIGPQKTLLLESLAPPITGIIAMLFLQKHLLLTQWLGVFLTIVGVTWVVTKSSTTSDTSTEMTPLLTNTTSSLTRLDYKGISFGLLASFCQATGVVLSHYALAETNISGLWGAIIRLTAGTFAVCIILMITNHKQLKIISALSKLTAKSLKLLFIAIFIGTFLALWLQQIALKFAHPATAQTLIATSPIFVLLLLFMQGKKVSSSALVGTLLSFLGIIFIFY
ncbi:DMT family transporter [Flocculibacter collagenilyticus]|uniref:DMT family transporter n=1 Tax=Flocculibacter collagenilyticus TaxID=2744479 RepID=UPI0018F78D94|nr:DMT family transporter [Flocculibacter collagenilyticus]